MPARIASVAISPSSALRTAAVISPAPSGCIIAYETRLIRSSPKRICGFITPLLARIEPSARSARWPGDRRRADVDRDAVRLVVEARPDGDDLAPLVDRDRHPVLAGLERRLERAHDLEVRLQPGQLPLALERLEQARQVAGRRRQLGRHDLDVVQADDRVHGEGAQLEALADDLAMDLALGRDVDEDVAADGGGAGQPAVGGEALLLAVRRLELRERREVARRRRDPVLRELAEALASPGSGRRSRGRRRPSRCRRPASAPRRGPSCPRRTGRAGRRA